jgi:hypothetical protein
MVVAAVVMAAQEDLVGALLLYLTLAAAEKFHSCF